MCYFDMELYDCGYWRWKSGGFRQQCTKEYRTGETCGLKLVYETRRIRGQCKHCDDIDKKQRRFDRLTNDIERWKGKENRVASLEKAQQEIGKVHDDLIQLIAKHNERSTMMAAS